MIVVPALSVRKEGPTRAGWKPEHPLPAAYMLTFQSDLAGAQTTFPSTAFAPRLSTRQTPFLMARTSG